MVKLDTFPPLDGYMMFAIFDDEIAVDGCIFQLLEFLPSGKLTKNYGKSPCYSWVNQLFRLCHFQARKLFVITRVEGNFLNLA
jgi:hypothetical protein